MSNNKTFLEKLYAKHYKEYGTYVNKLNNQEINATQDEIEEELTNQIKGAVRQVSAGKEVYFSREATEEYNKIVAVEYNSKEDFIHLQFDFRNIRIRLVNKKGSKITVSTLSIDKGVEDKVVERLPNNVREEVKKMLGENYK